MISAQSSYSDKLTAWLLAKNIYLQVSFIVFSSQLAYTSTRAQRRFAVTYDRALKKLKYELWSKTVPGLFHQVYGFFFWFGFCYVYITILKPPKSAAESY